MSELPDFLEGGEIARLIPVGAVNQRERVRMLSLARISACRSAIRAIIFCRNELEIRQLGTGAWLH